MEVNKIYIDGNWAPTIKGDYRTIINPYNQEKIAEVAEADREDAKNAIKAARQAFAKGEWSRISATVRGKMVYELGNLLEKNRAQLAEMETLNTGKTYTESLWDMDDIAGIFR
ncbi:MAG: aldehyde dehydrogenase family protein, partial [Cyclobacteriaceae bacterium]